MCSVLIKTMVQVMVQGIEDKPFEQREEMRVCKFGHVSNSKSDVLGDGRLRSVRVAHRAIPRNDPGSNGSFAGDRQTYISTKGS